jgi:PAS domain S-box-containing protein
MDMSEDNRTGKSYYDELSKQKITEHLDAIIDSSYDGLWICNGEGRVVRVNKASEEINGIKAEQVLNRKMEDLVKEGLIDRSVTMEVLQTGSTVTMIQYLRNGKQILVTGNPVFDENGRISLVVVNDRDISELNRLRSELDRTRALSREYHDELSQLYEKKRIYSDLIIRTETMNRVFNTAMKVARVDSTVLIQGESGVGKGLFAGLIHKASEKKNGPFIRVDCGAIPESLIESELFGYEGGAFTGARTKGKPGRFEMAERGTLFLDEIGELPLNIQVKLLRFLEEGEIVPIGGTRSKKIDARIIAATNRDLERMVEQKAFRRDLFFRLNVVPLQIPPLRERKEAIPSLIHHFLEKFNNKCGADKIILPPAIDCLCRYPFPGNIRELANLMEQLVVLSPTRNISEEDLPFHVREAHDGALKAMPSGIGWNLREATENVEKEMITKALKVFGSQRKASGPLGVNQSTLARKAKKYGIRTDAILHHDSFPHQ